MSETKLGSLIDKDARKDAVHVAVMPLLATRVLQPGEKTAHGVIDPFLDGPVQPGEWCWLLLRPGSVTSLRHVWTSPAFPEDL